MQPTKRVHKTLLRNVIRHTELHNRIVEEEECWRQYEAQQMSKCVEHENSKSTSRPKTVPRSYHSQSKSVPEDSDDEDAVHLLKKCRAHMDDAGEIQRQVYTDRDGERRVESNFWLRQLDAAESSDPNRWGHGGYKELYPQDFEHHCDPDEANSRSSSSSSQSDTRSTKKSKHKKKSSNDKDKKHRKKNKLKKHKTKKKSLETSPPTESRHRTNTSKRKHKRSSSKKKKRRHSDD